MQVMGDPVVGLEAHWLFFSLFLLNEKKKSDVILSFSRVPLELQKIIMDEGHCNKFRD